MQQFNVGDWVRQIKDNYSKFKRIYKIKFITESGTIAGVEDNIFDVDALGIAHGAFELWQPKVGEWCWFWNVGSTQYILAKFKTSFYDGRFINYETQENTVHLYCAPFIGELPSFLKEIT